MRDRGTFCSGTAAPNWFGCLLLCGTALAAPAIAWSQPIQQCVGYSKCPEVNYFRLLQTSRDARQVLAEDNATEAAALNRFRQGISGNAATVLLGKLVIYDANLSVNRNEPCAACHSRQVGFTSAVSSINRENVDLAGSTDERSSKRKPLSYAYAPFAPVLHYDAATQQFIGGNFWDMRATGLITGNPAGDQSLDPPLTPTEMDDPDSACVVFRIATGPYRDLFTQVWGSGSLDIHFPGDAQQRCYIPLSTHQMHPTILQLSPADRALATTAYHDMGKAVAMYEASPEVSSFSSKFDMFQAGKATLTPREMQGYKLFTGVANCSQCHAASGAHPLFTDFSAANIGVPRNRDLPYLYENRPDQYGFVANPAGPEKLDNGVGAFLASSADTNPQWKALAPRFIGTFQVATARNTALVPYATFQRDYMHNGYFKSLKQVVHFYNTRDVLPRCQGDPEIGTDGAGITCWPAPEQAANENKALLGNLGLTDAQENAIVAFLGTLSDTALQP